MNTQKIEQVARNTQAAMLKAEAELEKIKSDAAAREAEIVAATISGRKPAARSSHDPNRIDELSAQLNVLRKLDADAKAILEAEMARANAAKNIAFWRTSAEAVAAEIASAQTGTVERESGAANDARKSKIFELDRKHQELLQNLARARNDERAAESRLKSAVATAHPALREAVDHE